MKLSNHIIGSLVAAVIAVAFSFFFLKLGRGPVSNLFGVDENFYLKYYYDIVNYGDVGNDAIPDSLKIIDIHHYRNRHDIARILDRVYECDPSVIGLDVFFPKNSDIKDSVNHELIHILKKVQNKLVVPVNYNNGCVIYPFFSDDKDLCSISYASPIANDFFKHYNSDDISIVNSDSLSHQRMSSIITQLSKKPIQKHVRDNKKFYVNYCKKNLNAVIINDTSDISIPGIKNRIVLIGDLTDIKDMATLPFHFGGNKEISGIEDIAYSIISLCKNELQSFDIFHRVDSRMRLKSFTDWSVKESILVSVFLAFLFSLLHRKYSHLIKQSFEENRIKTSLLILAQPLWFIILEFMIVVLFYTITYFTNTIPDLLMSLIAMACVSTSNKLSGIILTYK